LIIRVKLFGAVFLATFCAAAAPPFSISEQNGITWLVKPGGERFFSLGVCVVDRGASREKFDPHNPGYAAWQHYSDSNVWAKAVLERLDSWGFTTIGGWSEFATLRMRPNTNVFFTPVLHIGSTAGAPWWDMWDTNNIARMDGVARDKILPLRDDPRVLGYYSDNEMGWWNATLFKMTLEQAPASGQRQRLIKLLRETYQDDWKRLLGDFEPEGAATFEELDRAGMLYLRSGGEGIRVMRRFLGLLADRYYFLMRELIRKYDQRALILGERYQSFYYPEVVRACAPYVDAVSSNLNAPWSDGTFPRFYLETLHALAKKPVLVSEFYMGARENRSGNKNTHGIYPVVDSQKQRAAGFRTTLEALARTPYVIGAEWFQYYDEATHGRGDGENFNFGLVDIHNRPYDLLISAARALDLAALKRNPLRDRQDASQAVPSAPRDPFANFTATLALKHWDRERGFVKPASEFSLADLYICWGPKAVYLGLYSQDIVENAFYRDKIIPKGDRAEWIVTPPAGQPIHARIGGGLEPIVNDRTIRVVNLSGFNLNVRNIACMELPAKLFGRDRLRAGDAIDLSATLFTHCRGYQVDWRGRFTLAKR
jgi:hypothetical protein